MLGQLDSSGRTYSNAGVAVRGEAMSSTGGTGVAGFAVNSRQGIGVYGHAYVDGYGVMGMIDSQDNSGAGVFGKAASPVRSTRFLLTPLVIASFP
jgi:hypothetical protein